MVYWVYLLSLAVLIPTILCTSVSQNQCPGAYNDVFRMFVADEGEGYVPNVQENAYR